MDYTFTNFAVGASNQFAYTAALAVANQPATALYNPLLLYGHHGVGKTHLLQAVQHHIGQRAASWRIFYVPAEHFMHGLRRALHSNSIESFRDLYHQADVFLVDDIQFMAGKPYTQEALFYTINWLFDAGKQIVLSSDTAPDDITPLDARLRSRLASGLVVDIQTPDLETRLAILQHKAAAHRISLTPEVARAIALRSHCSGRDLEHDLLRIIAYASLQAEDLNESIIHRIFQENVSIYEKKLTMARIQQAVIAYFNLKDQELTTKGRQRALTFPRQVAMFLCRELTQASFQDIGQFFGNRSHTTALHACTKIAQREEMEDDIARILEQLRQTLQPQPVEKCIKVFHRP